MGARTKARKRALDVLFEADQRGINAASVLDERIALSGRETDLPPYAIEVVRGVVGRWVELNAIIQDASPAWTIARMPAVDRALLRIATWEILCNDDVPVSVAIDEAVTLATGISTDDSPGFINGLLATVARDAPALSSDSGKASSGAYAGNSADSADAKTAHADDDVSDDYESVSWGPDAWGSDDDASGSDAHTAGSPASGARSPVSGARSADSSEDDAPEPEADADFADDGISDEVAQLWAEGLLGKDAVVIPMPDDADATTDEPADATTDEPADATRAAGDDAGDDVTADAEAESKVNQAPESTPEQG